MQKYKSSFDPSSMLFPNDLLGAFCDHIDAIKLIAVSKQIHLAVVDVMNVVVKSKVFQFYNAAFVHGVSFLNYDAFQALPTLNSPRRRTLAPRALNFLKKSFIVTSNVLHNPFLKNELKYAILIPEKQNYDNFVVLIEKTNILDKIKVGKGIN